MDVDVFITNYIYVDPDIFGFWLDGLTTSESVIQQRKKISSKIPLDLIASDVLDHYRTYAHLERFLDSPHKLENSTLNFQLEKASKMILIEKYYSLDDVVCRELLGKKLSSKYRKDLDEISEKTCIKLKSCRRQFDNIKRIQKAIDDQPAASLLKIIQREFLLSEDLAKKYCAIIFIANQRFELSKKKLQYLSFMDFFECSQSIMGYWTYVYQHSSDSIEEEFDKEFLLDLRELRCLFDKEREIKHLVLNRLKDSLLERSKNELEQNFRQYYRALIQIATSIHRSRELRNFFLELVEKLIEPWRAAHWNQEQVKNFLPVLTKSVLDLQSFGSSTSGVEIRCLFDRYMNVLNVCLLRMYHN